MPLERIVMSNMKLVAKADQELAAVRELRKDAEIAKERGNVQACAALHREAARRASKAAAMAEKGKRL